MTRRSVVDNIFGGSYQIQEVTAMNQTLTEDLAPASASQETGLLEAVKASKSPENCDESRLPLQTVDRVNSPTRKQKRYPIKWFLLLAAVLATAGWLAKDRLVDWLPISRLESAADMVKPKIEKVVSLGRLEPEGEVIEVAGPSGSGDARVQSLAVDVGDQVEAGQVLAVLDNNEQLQTEQAVAKAQVEQARVRLQQSRLIASTTYAQLHANLEALRSQRETNRADLRRQEQLRKSKASSEQEYEASLLGFTTSDKAVAEAEAKLARYTENPEDSVDVQVAQADIRVAEASLQNASAVLDRSLVRAPNAGTILDIDLRPGEQIGQRSLLRMGKTDAMLVRAEIYESDIAKIHTGQSATIHALAFEKPLTGTVEKVASLVQRQSIVDSDPAANTDARVVEVLVRIQHEWSDQAARFVGMQVTVEFPL
jgi:HlyD family secretion protein